METEASGVDSSEIENNFHAGMCNVDMYQIPVCDYTNRNILIKKWNTTDIGEPLIWHNGVITENVATLTALLNPLYHYSESLLAMIT